jgi:hypothetical protein
MPTSFKSIPQASLDLRWNETITRLHELFGADSTHLHAHSPMPFSLWF